MCGIAGRWVSDGQRLEDAERSLVAMLARIAHRGPDDSGIWTDANAGLLLGHRRLAVIDPSPLGHQPMLTEDGRLAVVFNGEIYNFEELRLELAARGVRFKSNSDTEVLLYGYREWGERMVERLVGMFAFAIWDVTTRSLFLARDRAGEKPLYYAVGRHGFAFASEVGALAQLPDVDDEIDPAALSLYLQYQYVPAPHSIYRGIRKLPPAHAMRVCGTEVTTWRYWDPVPLAAGPRLAISEEDAVTELESLLRTAVRGQMIADVPLGAFLSGGIDSTAVVSLMVELSTLPVRTFTVGFDDHEFDESRHAEVVAKHLGTDHIVEYLTERDALELIPQVPYMYGEPFADSSALPTHLVARIARRHVTVSLSGDGGDEAFGGYMRYPSLEFAAAVSGPGGAWGRAARPLVSRLPGRIGRGAELLGAPTDVYRRLVAVFPSSEVRALSGDIRPFEEFDRAWASTSRRPVRQRAMLADLLTYLPEAILVKVDRAAMATSLETRAPLLDHRVLEFALRLPLRLVRGKRVLKTLVYRRVPRALLERPKQGFGVPLSRWFRGELRSLVLDALSNDRMRAVGVQDYPLVKRIVDEHMSGSRDHPARLWALLVLSMWNDTRRERQDASATRHVGISIPSASVPTAALR
jgi:asparagine synthase (glutamine-hydrolysing)